MRRPLEYWSPQRFGDLVFRCWDDGAVVFDRANGNTHMLSLLGVELLEQLNCCSGQTVNSLLLILTDIFSGFDESDALNIISDSLELLAKFDLVTRDIN